MLGIVTVGLALLRAVDSVEADTFSVIVMQDFDGVAVENVNYLGSKICGDGVWRANSRTRQSDAAVEIACFQELSRIYFVRDPRQDMATPH